MKLQQEGILLIQIADTASWGQGDPHWLRNAPLHFNKCNEARNNGLSPIPKFTKVVEALLLGGARVAIILLPAELSKLDPRQVLERGTFFDRSSETDERLGKMTDLGAPRYG